MWAGDNEISAAEQVKMPFVLPVGSQLLQVPPFWGLLWGEGTPVAGQSLCTASSWGCHQALPGEGAGGVRSCLPFIQVCWLSQDPPEGTKHPLAQLLPWGAGPRSLLATHTPLRCPGSGARADLCSLAAARCFPLPC